MKLKPQFELVMTRPSGREKPVLVVKVELKKEVRDGYNLR